MNVSHALLLGVDSFPEDPSLQDLDGVASSLDCYEQWLLDGIDRENLVRICSGTGPPVTAAVFWSSLRGFISKVEKASNSVAIVYIATHGFNIDGLDCIAVSNTVSSLAPETAIKVNDIVRDLDSLGDSHHFVLIIDACRAGSIGIRRIEWLSTSNSSVTVIYSVRAGQVAFVSGGLSSFSSTFFGELSGNFGPSDNVGKYAPLASVLSSSRVSMLQNGTDFELSAAHLDEIFLPTIEVHTQPLAVHSLERVEVRDHLASHYLRSGNVERTANEDLNLEIAVMTQKASELGVVLSKPKEDDLTKVRSISVIEVSGEISPSNAFDILLRLSQFPMSFTFSVDEQNWAVIANRLRSKQFNYDVITRQHMFVKTEGHFMLTVTFDTACEELSVSATPSDVRALPTSNKSMLRKLVNFALRKE